jgi:hypothetical protein
MSTYRLRYLWASALYGAFHSAVNSSGYAVYRRPDGTKKRQPVLLTHRIINICASGVFGPLLWPFMAYYDLTRVECALRGRDAADYSFFALMINGLP